MSAMNRRPRQTGDSRTDPPVEDGADAEPTMDPLLALPRAAATVIVTIWAWCILIGAAWYVQDSAGFWFLSGSIACLIVSMPMLIGARRYEVISPWTLIVIAAYIGFGVRGVFMSLGVNGSRTLEQLYFLGHGPGYFVRPTLLFLLGLVMLTLGYIVVARREPGKRPSITARPHLSASGVRTMVIVCAVLGLIGFVLFAATTGGFSLARISAKRTVINGVDLNSSYQSHGEFRVLNAFGPIALWLQLAWYAARRVPHGPLTLRFGWLAMLFLNAALLPIYASTRADVVYIILGAVVVEYCLGGGRIRLRLALGSVGLAIVLSAAVSSLRYSDNNTVGGVSLNSNVLVDTFVLTRTFADIPTTGNIIKAVPDRLPYANGSTISAWAVAPIPRSIWPNKPLISSGPILGSVIYGNEHSGVPPGMMAEAYWNFGLGGIVVLPFLCGMAFRWLNDRWAPYARSSPAAAVVMAAVAVHPGIDMMVNSIGAAPYQLLQSFVLLVPVLLLASAKTAKPPKGHVVAAARPGMRRPQVAGRWSR
jgi:oligosaccharide repeat unit polymerase